MTNKSNISVPDYTQKHKDDLTRLKGLRLIDDDFMTKVFEDKECAEFLLRIILGRNDISVVTASSQYGIKNLQGRSIRLDILAIDQQGRFFNVEIQRSDKGACMKRARYNSALLDANITEPGEELQNLLETFVIFITENDVLNGGLPIYHIERIITELHQNFNDGEHIIYVNSRMQDDTALGKLMQDFMCTSADQMNYPILANRVRYFKEDKKGVQIMCKALEDMCKEAAVLAIIKVTRNFDIQEDQIKTYIINEFQFSSEEAQEVLNTLPLENRSAHSRDFSRE